MRASMSRRAGLATMAVALGLGLVACGDDDETADETTSTTAAEAEAAAYCDPFFEFQQKLFDGPDDPAEGVTYVKNELETVLADLETGADDATGATKDAITGLVAKIRGATTADKYAAVSKEFQEGGEAIQQFSAIQLGAADDCGYEKVEVEAVDYEFEGVPDELDAGKYAFVFENAGEEPHEMIWFKVKSGTTETLDELLAIEDEAELGAKVEQAGGGFAPPGQRGVVFLEMEAGRYGYVCFIPVGGGEDGAPHHSEGMKGEVTVS